MLSDFRLTLLAKFLCFAIIAIGIGLAWGQGGMLVLGQGLFFGLGGYCMGMYMKLDEAGPGQLPDFMTWSGRRRAARAVGAVPARLVRDSRGDHPADGDRRAARRGGLPPARARRVLRDPHPGARGRVRHRARRQPGPDRRNERADELPDVLRAVAVDPQDKRILYFVVVIALLLVFLATRELVLGRYGRLLIAWRDDEDRVRFLGYDPTRVKLVAYVLAAGMAGLAGALFVPVVGIISPALLGIVPSIEMVIWVALGGRTALAWAAAGAVIVNWAKTQHLRAVPVDLAVPPGAAVRRRHRVPAQGLRRPVAQLRALVSRSPLALPRATTQVFKPAPKAEEVA